MLKLFLVLLLYVFVLAFLGVLKNIYTCLILEYYLRIRSGHIIVIL